MGHTIQLNTSRMQCVGAYVAEPAGVPRGGIVVVQEIFGVNAWVRSVADRFAAHGYTAIAPAFFDHVESGVELAYDPSSFERGKALVSEVGLDLAVEDVASAAAAIASAGRIGCVGYCWGGTVALLAAIRLGLPAASYYGARNAAFFGQSLKAPAQFHFGALDSSISADVVARHREAWPDAEVYSYAEAGHAFDRDVDPKAHVPAAATLARERTLAFFERNVAST